MIFRRFYYKACTARGFWCLIVFNIFLFIYIKTYPNNQDKHSSKSLFFEASTNYVMEPGNLETTYENADRGYQILAALNTKAFRYGAKATAKPLTTTKPPTTTTKSPTTTKKSTTTTTKSPTKTTKSTTTTTKSPTTTTKSPTTTTKSPTPTTKSSTTTTKSPTTLTTQSPTKISPTANRQTKPLTLSPRDSRDLETKVSTRKQGLIVDWWLDVCFKKSTWNTRWLPLFPHYPEKTTTTLAAGDLNFVRHGHFRRMHGYLKPKQTGNYQIQLKSRDGSEMVLLDDINNEIKNSQNTVLEYWNLTLDEMTKQEDLIPVDELYDAGTKTVWLNESNNYPIEIIQIGLAYGMFEVLWKTPSSNSFQIIGEEYIWYHPHVTAKQMPSKLCEMNQPVPKYDISENENRRLSFHKIPVLQTSDKIKNSNFQCPPTNWYKRNVDLYLGRIYVDYTLVYPKSHFEYVGYGWPLNHILIPENEALDVANRTFLKINQLFNNSLRLKDIVHIQYNIDGQFNRYPEWWKTHYFVELDVLNAGELQRSSVFVHSTQKNEICFMSDYAWKKSARINLLTPVRNQLMWLKYMAVMLQDLVKKANEINVNWIVIDFNSTDGNVASVLNSYNVPHEYLRVETNTSFNKVKCLNTGLNYVEDDDSIVFVLDLHLEIPLNMFDRIRKLTIRGKTAFCPTLLKFQCGEHEQYTEGLHQSLWIDDGFGMMAMYKSDWTRVGGFNEKLFGNKWGGEDWELVDRIVREGIFVVHNRMPRFYHNFHTNHKTWDGTHL